MRVAMTSDNHLDINKVDIEQTLAAQAQYLKDNHVGIYLIAGDLFNKFSRSEEYVEKLQRRLPRTKVFFIAGNHDMLNDIDYAGVEKLQHPQYLHNQFYDVPGTKWRIIGNNGWYDYSFADNVDKTPEQFWRWKKTFWVDTAIEQPISDIERMDRVLQQTERQLQAAQSKSVLFMTHFAVRHEYIRYTDDYRFWNMANGMMGSRRMEKLLAKYQPKIILSGHLHFHYKPLATAGGIYYNNSVGYHKRRINEWNSDNFITEWTQRLLIIDLE